MSPVSGASPLSPKPSRSEPEALLPQVEQERFVVKPFSLGLPPAAEEPPTGETPRMSEFERSTTRIMRQEMRPRLHRASAFTPAASFSAGTSG